MNPADPKALQTALFAQGSLIHQYQEQLTAVGHGVRGLSDRQEGFQTAVTAQVNQLATQLQQILTRLETPDVPTAPPPVNPAAGQAEVQHSFHYGWNHQSGFPGSLETAECSWSSVIYTSNTIQRRLFPKKPFWSPISPAEPRHGPRLNGLKALPYAGRIPISMTL